jgi:hypothetical protein
MRRTLEIALLAGLLVLVPVVHGDRIVIPPTAFAKVQVPDQSALIAYDRTTERLLIEISFIGAGTNFAWIVPVPSAPEVRGFASSEKIFLRFEKFAAICRQASQSW